MAKGQIMNCKGVSRRINVLLQALLVMTMANRALLQAGTYSNSFLKLYLCRFVNARGNKELCCSYVVPTLESLYKQPMNGAALSDMGAIYIYLIFHRKGLTRIMSYVDDALTSEVPVALP